jgi:hypothetical protein
VGLLRWIRGDDDYASTSMMSAGLAEIAGLFQPTRHKQTEHVEEMSRRRLDLSNGTGSGVDLDAGVAVIRRNTPKQPSPDE